MEEKKVYHIKVWLGDIQNEEEEKKRFKLAYRIGKEKMDAGAKDVIIHEIDEPAPKNVPMGVLLINND